MTPTEAVDHYGSVAAAARALGIPRTTFRRRLSEGAPITSAPIPIDRGLVVQAPPSFNLYLTSDWHYGSPACDEEALGSMLESVEEDDKARVIIGGDLTECTPAGHHDGGHDDLLLDDQICGLIDLLRPVASKITLILGGNHGKPRLVKRGVTIDPDKVIARALGVPYSTVPKCVDYRAGSASIKIMVGHGFSGAQDPTRELRRMREVMVGGDLYVLGHDHSLIAEQDGAMVYEGGRERWSPVWLCRSGSFLTWAEYARFRFYRPKPIGYLVARITEGEIDTVSVRKS